MDNKLFRLLIGSIIAISLSLSFFSGADDVITVDELPHIGAGYSYWHNGKLQLNPEHPPLAKLVATLPLAIKSNDDSAFSSSYWNKNDPHYTQYEFTSEFLYKSRNDPDQLTQLARLFMLIFPLIALIVTAMWSYRISGYYASIVATAFLGFSPTFLAHAKLITTDIPIMSLSILTLYFFSKFLDIRYSKYAIYSGLALGCALLVKFSGVLLIPVLGLIFFLNIINDHKRARLGEYINLGGIFAIALTIVFIVYAVFDRNTPISEYYNYLNKIVSAHSNDWIAQMFNSVSGFITFRPLISYLLGFVQVLDHNKYGHTAYFLGTISSSGSFWYFPIVFVIKETLGHILLLIFSSILAIKILLTTGVRKISRNIDFIALGSWFAVYLAISLVSDINIGIRHILPIFPVIAIFVGVILGGIIENIKTRLIVGVVIILMLTAETFYAYPYYIPFFNILGGGSENGYKLVADSNVDWGQDLKRLAVFVGTNNIRKIELAYFSGWSDPNYYLKDKFVWLTEDKYSSKGSFIANSDTDGWLAISVQFLQTNPKYSWLQKEKPIAKIGYSIFVYRLK